MVVLVVVLVDAQPVAVQASQQLSGPVLHAVPSFGAVQAAALRRMAHLVSPLVFVRQQVTKPGRPHVDRLAHRCATPSQSWLVSEVVRVSAEQRRYVCRLVPVQLHARATAVRAFATSVLSGSRVGSQAAPPVRMPSRTSETAARETRALRSARIGAAPVELASCS